MPLFTSDGLVTLVLVLRIWSCLHHARKKRLDFGDLIRITLRQGYAYSYGYDRWGLTKPRDMGVLPGLGYYS